MFVSRRRIESAEGRLPLSSRHPPARERRLVALCIVLRITQFQACCVLLGSRLRSVAHMAGPRLLVQGPTPMALPRLERTTAGPPWREVP